MNTVTTGADDTTPVVVKQVTSVGTDALVRLYRSVGWTAYTADPDRLARAVTGSSLVLVACRGDALLGLARAVSDGETICYLQDVLVVPEEQRRGIGRLLVEAVLQHYAAVRQKVLLTDDTPEQRAFYGSLGYTDVGDFPGGVLRAFVRLDG